MSIGCGCWLAEKDRAGFDLVDSLAVSFTGEELGFFLILHLLLMAGVAQLQVGELAFDVGG